MKITFIGTGQVGGALAAGLANAGHDVVLAEARPGSRSVVEALARSPRLSARPLAQAVDFAEVVFLATPSPRTRRCCPHSQTRSPARCWLIAPTPWGRGSAMAFPASARAAKGCRTWHPERAL